MAYEMCTAHVYLYLSKNERIKCFLSFIFFLRIHEFEWARGTKERDILYTF